MTLQLDAAVELLDRGLAYTRVQLGGVDDTMLAWPTPCTEWRLADLLAHMDDALDAFTEAAGGCVTLVPAATSAPGRVFALQQKACALLGAWSHPAPGDVRVGDRDLASPLVVATAALEVSVHGWDVGRATGAGRPLPDALAAALLPVAEATVGSGGRGVRFGAARRVPPGASAGSRLLADLGRS